MAAQTPEAARLRGLKVLVSVLGVLVVLGTALVIGVVIHRIYAKPAAASMQAAIPGVAPGVSSGLPVASGILSQGEHIDGMAGAGGAIAVWVSGPDGDRILLISPDTGKVRVAITAAK